MRLARRLVLLLALGLAWLATDGLRAGGLPWRAGDEDGRVVRVVDGDTLDVALRGERVRVRLLGIDTPESVRPGTPVECGDREAASRLLALTFSAPRDMDGDGLFDREGGRGRRVVVEGDRSQDAEDRYGRRVAYVRRRGERWTLQERLLRAGWAVVYVHRGRAFARLPAFRTAARAARKGGRGLHRACDERPHADAAERAKPAR